MSNELDGSSLRRNATANMAGRIITAVLWVGVTPLALDRLGVAGFGVWSLFFALTGSAGVLDLGAANGAARFVALGLGRSDPGFVRLAIRRAMLLSITFGFAWGSMCVLAREPIMGMLNIPAALRTEAGRAMLLLGPWMLLFASSQALQGALMGFQRLDLSNVSLVAGVVVHIAVLATMLHLGHGLVGAAAAGVCGHAVALLIAYGAVVRLLAHVEHAPEVKPLTWRAFIGFGAAVQSTNGFIVGQIQAPKFALAVLGQIAWVTQFELAMRVAVTLWSIPTLVQGAVIPAAAGASAEPGVAALRRIYEWSCRWIIAAASILLGGLWVLAPAVFVLWLGPDQPGAAHIARLLAFAFAASILAGPAAAVARGGGMPVLETIHAGIAFLLQIALAAALIPWLGITGAVLGLGLSFLVAAVWLLHRFHSRMEMSTWAWFKRWVLPRYSAAAGAGAITWSLFGRHVISSRTDALMAILLQGAVYTVVYLVLTWRTGDLQAVATRFHSRFGGAR